MFFRGNTGLQSASMDETPEAIKTPCAWLRLDRNAQMGCRLLYGWFKQHYADQCAQGLLRNKFL